MFKKLISTLLLVSAFVSSAFAEDSRPQVIMQTNLGEIKLELFQEESPNTVKNFLTYVDNGFYEGTIFHRTIAGFMIQGGGFTKDMEQKDTLDPIKNESTNGLSNKVGTIAMARTRHPHSATSQFFINTVNNPNLDTRGNRYGYAVFGRVLEGADLVLQISRTPTTAKNGHQNVPKQPIIIKKVSRVTP